MASLVLGDSSFNILSPLEILEVAIEEVRQPIPLLMLVNIYVRRARKLCSLPRGTPDALQLDA